jgi:hypothetical protein
MLLPIRARYRRARLVVLERIARLATRLAVWATNQSKRERVVAHKDEGLAKVRFAICEACPRLKGAAPLERCDACGCLMRGKVQFVNAKCPDGRW